MEDHVPKVTVCIDVYNYGQFLAQAIESVLVQTFVNFELIIVDDCSQDNSFAIALEYAAKDNRIVALENICNLGMVQNRNACLRAARGEYIKFLHADDFLCSTEALSKMVAVMDSNPAISLVASARRIVNVGSEEFDVWSCFEITKPLAGTSVINRCLREQRNLVGGPSAVMFRRDRAARGFDESFFVMADVEMWFHLLEQGCFAYLSEPLCAFREHKTQQTQKDRGTLQPAFENQRLLRRYLHKSYVRLRPWLKSYLRHDAVHRIVRRSGRLVQLSVEYSEMIQDAVAQYGSREYLVRQPLRVACAAALKLTRLFQRHLRPWLKKYAIHKESARNVRPIGINVAGFFGGEYGIGESSRAFSRAVRESGVPYELINLDSRMHSNRDRSVTRFSGDNSYRLNLMTFSFDYARRFYRDRGGQYFAGCYNIGLWYWEQEQFPARWHSAFDFYDEVWVPSRFTESALRMVSPVPVRKITYPLYFDPKSAAAKREDFRLKEDTYVFLYSFDFLSTIQRKNPMGAIEAFRKAFTSTENVALVLKSINSGHDRDGRAMLAKRAEGAQIIFMDSHLSGIEMNALFKLVDSYVSLHRSEGLGLGMAQAMLLGKPVIATGYSGNLEFMNHQNSLLIDYEMKTLEETCGPYEKGSFWAEPNTEHAAALMRHVYMNREESVAFGVQASQDVRRILNPELTQRQIRRRIEEIGKEKHSQ
jgi:glycosyltransferase involved in cell wall biosynthesis